MLEALACRGPDSAGVAVIGPARASAEGNVVGPGRGRHRKPRSSAWPAWANCRGSAPTARRSRPIRTLRFDFRPAAGVTSDDLEHALGACRGGVEVLGLGRRLDLVKRVGPPAGLESAYDSPHGSARWRSAIRGCPPRAGST